MQNQDAMQIKIERLLVDLNACINDLQALQSQLSHTDLIAAKRSQQKLDALFCSHQEPATQLRFITV